MRHKRVRRELYGWSCAACAVRWCGWSCAACAVRCGVPERARGGAWPPEAGRLAPARPAPACVPGLRAAACAAAHPRTVPVCAPRAAPAACGSRPVSACVPRPAPARVPAGTSPACAAVGTCPACGPVRAAACACLPVRPGLPGVHVLRPVPACVPGFARPAGGPVARRVRVPVWRARVVGRPCGGGGVRARPVGRLRRSASALWAVCVPWSACRVCGTGCASGCGPAPPGGRLPRRFVCRVPRRSVGPALCARCLRAGLWAGLCARLWAGRCPACWSASAVACGGFRAGLCCSPSCRPWGPCVPGAGVGGVSGFRRCVCGC